MHVSTEAPPRALRADAERNRVRVLTAAREVLAERGLDAPTEEIARRAGVGVGTLYRRFPTKDLLVQAALAELQGRAVAEIEEAARHPDPWEAVAGALRGLAETLHANRAFVDAIRPRLAELECLPALGDALRAAVRPAFARAHAAGVLRADVVPEDVPGIVVGVASFVPKRRDVDPELWRRYLGVLLDGLRPVAATPLPLPAPS